MGVGADPGQRESKTTIPRVLCVATRSSCLAPPPEVGAFRGRDLRTPGAGRVSAGPRTRARVRRVSEPASVAPLGAAGRRPGSGALATLAGTKWRIKVTDARLRSHPSFFVRAVGSYRAQSESSRRPETRARESQPKLRSSERWGPAAGARAPSLRGVAGSPPLAGERVRSRRGREPRLCHPRGWLAPCRL